MLCRGRASSPGDQARRRFERDLHDGAQQRLVNMVITLGLAQRALGDENAQAAELVRDPLDGAERGVEEMRELARGIHPRILPTGGLGPALETLAERSPIPVTLDLRTGRPLAEHVLSISDDGVGGADPMCGSGLVGAKDRVEALGGTVTVHSRAGEGTPR